MSLRNKVLKGGKEPQPTPKEESEARIQLLSNGLFKATQQASIDAKSDFTFSELVHCFTKLLFQFNKRNLDQQQEHGLEKRPEDIEVNESQSLN